jgi:hypothetical protein
MGKSSCGVSPSSTSDAFHMKEVRKAVLHVIPQNVKEGRETGHGGVDDDDDFVPDLQ